MNIKDIVKDNHVYFNRLRNGIAYYNVVLPKVEVKDELTYVPPVTAYDIDTYEFPVPLSDIGDATLLATDKAIMFMRYIRKALENKEFIKVS